MLGLTPFPDTFPVQMLGLTPFTDTFHLSLAPSVVALLADPQLPAGCCDRVAFSQQDLSIPENAYDLCSGVFFFPGMLPSLSVLYPQITATASGSV
jgi:hypothetical protein